jgi:hypothetical protein
VDVRVRVVIIVTRLCQCTNEYTKVAGLSGGTEQGGSSPCWDVLKIVASFTFKDETIEELGGGGPPCTYAVDTVRDGLVVGQHVGDAVSWLTITFASCKIRRVPGSWMLT